MRRDVARCFWRGMEGMIEGGMFSGYGSFGAIVLAKT